MRVKYEIIWGINEKLLTTYYLKYILVTIN